MESIPIGATTDIPFDLKPRLFAHVELPQHYDNRMTRDTVRARERAAVPAIGYVSSSSALGGRLMSVADESKATRIRFHRPLALRNGPLSQSNVDGYY